MDKGLKRARWTSFTIWLGMVGGMLLVAALQHYGIMPPDPSPAGGVVRAQEMPKPGIVKLEVALKAFEAPARKERWPGSFVVARTYPNYFGGQQLVVVMRDNRVFHASLASGDQEFRVGEAVEFGTVKFTSSADGDLSTEHFYVQHKR